MLALMTLLLACQRQPDMPAEGAGGATDPAAPPAAPAPEPPAEQNELLQPPLVNAPPAGSVDCSGGSATSIPDAWLACGSDQDCAEVQTTCCPCSAGGKSIVIAAGWASCVKPECREEGMMCAQVFQCEPGAPRCVSGRCQRVAP